MIYGTYLTQQREGTCSSLAAQAQRSRWISLEKIQLSGTLLEILSFCDRQE
jgi:hypothetical protein